MGMTPYAGMLSKFALGNITISNPYVSVRLRFEVMRVPQPLKSRSICAAEAWFPNTCWATGARVGNWFLPLVAHQPSTSLGCS
ncbi:unnamed protein product [Ectocarpus sp. CCAP 1310/34]|nr:unnamed protein product [Ectocarpus sp. CCAP 1310/34]